MNLHELTPLAKAEDFLVNLFNLQEKGRKLIRVGFIIFGTEALVSIVQLGFIRFTCHLSIYYWLWSMVWLSPIFAYVGWRYFFRYLNPKAFVCDRCGRLKLPRHRHKDSTENHNVCAKCDDQRSVISGILKKVEHFAELLFEWEKLKKGKDYPTIGNPIIYNPEKDD